MRKVSKRRTLRSGFKGKTFKRKSYKRKTMRRKLYKRNTYKRKATNRRRYRRVLGGGKVVKITVKGINGKQYDYNMYDNDTTTFGMIRNRIHEGSLQEGKKIPLNQIVLCTEKWSSWSDRQILGKRTFVETNDDNTLLQGGIKKNTTLYMILFLGPGRTNNEYDLIANPEQLKERTEGWNAVTKAMVDQGIYGDNIFNAVNTKDFKDFKGVSPDLLTTPD